MIELVLTAVLTCQEANSIASRALLNSTITNDAAAGVIAELQAISPPGCVLPQVN